MEPCEPDKLIEAPAEPSLILEGLLIKLLFASIAHKHNSPDARHGIPSKRSPGFLFTFLEYVL